MLYDILSPFIFFASLGGILLIVGRVVIRIRRQQFTTSIKSAGALDVERDRVLASQTSSQLTQLLKPTQKSVQVFKTRVGVLGNMVSETRHGLTQGVRNWRRRREASKTAPIEPVTPSVISLQPSAPTEGGIIAPERRSWLKRLRRGVRPVAGAPSGDTLPENEQAAPQLSSLPTPTTTPTTPVTVPAVSPDRSFKLTRTETAPASAASTNGAVPASSEERLFVGGVLRRKRAKTPVSSALEQALAAISSAHYQQAEDVLVPYIVKHPKDTTAYMLLGRAAMGREAWNDAIEIFEQVLRWNEKEHGAYAALGHANYKAGNFTKALQVLQRAHEADPSNQTVLEELLSIAQKMDNPALQHSIREKMTTLPNSAEASEVPEEQVGSPV